METSTTTMEKNIQTFTSSSPSSSSIIALEFELFLCDSIFTFQMIVICALICTLAKMISSTGSVHNNSLYFFFI